MIFTDIVSLHSDTIRKSLHCMYIQYIIQSDDATITIKKFEMITLKLSKSDQELLAKYKRAATILERKCTFLSEDINRLSAERSLIIKKAKVAVTAARQEARNARFRAKRLKIKLELIQSKRD